MLGAIQPQVKPFSLPSLRNSPRSVRSVARDARERFLRVALLTCFPFSLAAYRSPRFNHGNQSPTMKTVLAFVLLFIAATSFALDIATTDKKLFQDCEVKSVEKDGLRIMHRDGTAFLDFDTLPVALQKKYGWTAEKSVARKAEKAAEAERQRVAAENTRRVMEEKAAAVTLAESQQNERVKAEQLRTTADAEAKHGQQIAHAENERTKWIAIGISILAVCVVVFWKIVFLPVRLARGKSNYNAVLIMNIVGLFTLIGWLIALYMALNNGEQRVTAVNVTVNNNTRLPSQPSPVAVPRPVAQVQPVAVPRVVAKPLPPSVNPPPPSA